MVKKVAFIVEGGTEVILLKSIQFKEWIESFGLELVVPIVNGSGGGNLLPHNIGSAISTLKAQQADHIFILTDLEREPSISAVKARLAHPDVKDCFITILATESWFLACTEALSKWLKTDHYVDDPENRNLDKPSKRFKALCNQYNARGCASKPKLAQHMLDVGFRFEKVLEHPNCTSIKYIEQVLRSL